MKLLDVCAGLGLAWYVSIGLISLGGWLCVLLVYNRPTLPDGTHEDASAELLLHRSDGVSILRPMSGLDPDLYYCLQSSFAQDYGLFEVILSVKSEDDPAIEVAKRVIAEYPHVDAHLIIGDVEVGVNPKVNNLIRSFEQCKYPFLWILDSNSWTSPGTLSRAMRILQNPKVNLVHHIPVAHAARDAQFGALLDDIYMGTMHAKMYAIINYLCVAPCVMGKSNVIRKSALPDDGIASFGKFIAEDHLLAVNIWRGRGSHVLAPDCVRQPLLEVSGAQYCMRRIRWIRVRKYMTTAATLVEPFTEAMLLGLIGAFSIFQLTAVSWWAIWLLHIAIWMAMDYTCWNRLRNYPHDMHPPFSKDASSCMSPYRWLTSWAARESTAFLLWCIAMSNDRIYWRGSRFVIHRDMTAQRIGT